jgi:hypothetical protein
MRRGNGSSKATAELSISSGAVNETSEFPKNPRLTFQVAADNSARTAFKFMSNQTVRVDMNIVIGFAGIRP